jgi:hypothetical protein
MGTKGDPRGTIRNWRLESGEFGDGEIVICWIGEGTEIRPVMDSIGYQIGMAPDQRPRGV